MAQTIFSILSVAARTGPNAIAATLRDDAMTFADVLAASARAINMLDALGLKPGDRLVLQAEFELEHLSLFFATQYLGVIFAPVNPAFRAAEVQEIIDYLQPAMLVQDVSRAANGAVTCDGMRHAIVGGTFGDRPESGALDLSAHTQNYTPTPVLASPVQPDDIHAIFLTSGSTGRSKGVEISHQASWLRSHIGASRFVNCGGRGELLTFPMFHWAGWNYLMENWAHKRAVHFIPNASGDEIAQAITRHDPAFIYAIPAIWERVLGSQIPFDGSRLRQIGSGTSKFDVELMERLKARFPNAYRGIFYGSTEFGGACSLIDEEIVARAGSVGLPGSGIEARIVDGEMQLRGPTVMKGYYNLPDQTADVFDDDWYRTGDLVEMDADGFITIVGRAREVIRSGGETIAPAEVELALRDFPGLRGVAIVGLDDPVWGEIVCAVTELEEGCDCPQVESLRSHLEGRIATFKHPRRVVVLAELPRTAATGQIMRSRIKQLVAEGHTIGDRPAKNAGQNHKF